jgi:ABC-type hemin transport system substrate-binding protein
MNETPIQPDMVLIRETQSQQWEGMQFKFTFQPHDKQTPAARAKMFFNIRSGK